MLTTNQKGAIAEMAIAQEAIRLGLGVYRPIADERADLILDLRPRLVRVQCKTATRRGDVLVVGLYSARRTANGLRRTPYSEAEIDAFAAHCLETGTCYFFEWHDLGCRTEMRLRLRPTRNNQAIGVKWARDFEFGAKLERPLGP
jgi:hypothetical protein